MSDVSSSKNKEKSIRKKQLQKLRHKQHALMTHELEPPDGKITQQQDIVFWLCTAQEQHVTGSILFQCNHDKITLFFEQGIPVDVASSVASDAYHHYLLRLGKLTKEQTLTLDTHTFPSRRSMASFILKQGYIKKREIYDTLRSHVESILIRMCAYEEGLFAFSPESIDKTCRIMIDRDLRSLLLEGIARKYSLERMMLRLGSPQTILAFHPNSDLQLKGIGLTPAERMMIRSIDGQKTIDDLICLSGLSLDRTYQIITLLVSIRMLLVRVQAPIDNIFASQDKNDQIDAARILHKYNECIQESYLAMLGLDAQASTYEITKAYEYHTQQFDSKRFSATISQEYAEQLRSIQEILNEAYQVLKNEQQRHLYIQHAI